MSDRMFYLVPAYTAAIQDHELRGRARDVYLWLFEHLDLVEYRPVKHAVIERELRMNDIAVSRALQKLLQTGYITRGAKDGPLWTYRLYFSRRDHAAHAAPSPQKCG